MKLLFGSGLFVLLVAAAGFAMALAEGGDPAVRAALHAAGCLERATLARPILPVAGLLLVAALGLAFELRGRGRIPSPALAYLAKKAGVLALGAVAAYITWPLSFPLWSMYCVSVVLAAAALLYVSNLPARL